MKGYLIFILVVIITGSVLAYDCYRSETPNKYIYPSMNVVKDMKYHGEPTYYWTLTGSNWCLAGYFEPYKFGVTSNAFRLYNIGFIGYIQNGSANIYLFLSEVNGKPDCTPPDFSKKKYGPYNGHINNSYPNYDDLDLYGQNWVINKSEIDAQVNKRFWILYHLPTSPPPYPISDESTNEKNSRLIKLELAGLISGVATTPAGVCMLLLSIHQTLLRTHLLAQ
jgi:hypothetical protein